MLQLAELKITYTPLLIYTTLSIHLERAGVSGSAQSSPGGMPNSPTPSSEMVRVPCVRGAAPGTRPPGACMAGAVSHQHAARRAASPLEETKVQSVPCSVASVPPLKQPQQVSDSGGNFWGLLLQCLSLICQIKSLCTLTLPHLCRVLGLFSPQKLIASKVPYITTSPRRLQSAPLIRDLLKS